jgi:hypothetical protein
MTPSLDFILLPLHRQNDRDLAEIPGLLATQSPRRAARGRSLDNLVVHLALEGTAPLSPKGYNKLVGHLVDLYYKTPGSSTTAMRTVAEWLNDYLIERNMRGASRSMQSVGLFSLVVFRGNRLYLAQCGPTHAFLIKSSGLAQYHESDLEGRGLGLGRATNIRYHQDALSPNDLLLISADPPPIWTTTVLISLRGMSLSQIHLRLIHQIGPELQAALIQVDPGSGKLKVLRPEPVREDQKTPGLMLEPQRREILKETKSPIERESVVAISPPQGTPRAPEPSISQGAGVETEVIRAESHSTPTHPGVVVTPIQDPSRPVKVKPQRQKIIGPALLKIGQAMGDTFGQAFKGTSHLIKRMLPDDSLLSIPTSVMAFIAIAVPIVVVAIAATAYFQRGRARMYEEHYLQAEYAAEQALQLSDAPALRDAWHTVLDHLGEAEAYQITENSQAMHSYALNVLDNLDVVMRLPFQPALAEKLPQDAIIKRIVAREGDNELYLLNETDGHVIRTTLTERGYQIDPDFVCEPVPKPLIVGGLVDIISLPPDDPNNAVIMGMDANGNLMQCVPGGKPPLTSQMPPPDMSWGRPTAFDMNSAGLYILDPVTNAVWIFWRNDEFSELPTLFFDEHIPPMGDVIDLTLNRDDLFLIHNDGHLTTCTFGYPTRCQDPAMINDLRDGGESGPKIDNAVFREIQFAPPPDPSLYLLEPETPSIYHFSVRLSYQRQYRSLNPLPEGPATAFTVSPNRQVFLAIGNQVFVSPLP